MMATTSFCKECRPRAERRSACLPAFTHLTPVIFGSTACTASGSARRISSDPKSPTTSTRCTEAGSLPVGGARACLPRSHHPPLLIRCIGGGHGAVAGRRAKQPPAAGRPWDAGGGGQTQRQPQDRAHGKIRESLRFECVA